MSLKPQQPVKDKSRFELFVKLKPGTASAFPNQKRVWCYPGNKFTDEHPKQLKNLLKLLNKNIADYWLIELYDCDYSKEQEERIIYKVNAGTIEINRLSAYQDYLTNFLLPDIFKLLP